MVKKMFLPDRYGTLFSKDLQELNDEKNPLFLVYKGLRNIENNKKIHDFNFIHEIESV